MIALNHKKSTRTIRGNNYNNIYVYIDNIVIKKEIDDIEAQYNINY